MISNVVNYYDILEVHQEVSTEEIRRSFRTLIKKYHPDIHSQNKHWAESKTKIIIQAYKTLSDTTTREQYDRLHGHHLQKNRTRRPTKGSHTQTKDDDIRAQVRLILNDLLNGHARKAIEKYEQLLKDYDSVEFLLHLKHRDYIDCKFLLAEAYEKLGQYEVAIELYEYLCERGKDTHHRHHLLAEVKERIRNIYCRKLTRSAPPEKALGYYEKVLRLKLDKSESAFIYKKMAECYFELEDYENAQIHLNTAVSLKPNIQGLNKIKAKLKQQVPNFAI